MSVTLDLAPEVLAQLEAQANARGLALTDYLKQVVELQASVETEMKPKRSAAEAVAHIRELRKGVTLDGLRIKDLVNEGRR